ncbi:MAG: hypothetical protein HZC36_02590 [Armatimonadetes bacterium]|nr:hypothetical protein [Armatimonadota bacterium]
MQQEDSGNAMKRTLVWVIAAAMAAALLPLFMGALIAYRTGDWYAGFKHSFDDQMVYAAWMTQAQDGHFLMDNRFAVDPQPGLTINVYFFVLGLISKLFGIPLTLSLARAGFAALFVLLLYRFLCRISPDTYFQKLGLCVGVFGSGFGFLVWHRFGDAFIPGDNALLSSLMGGRLPIDVWQSEAFVFPSMLTNGLFMAALCLILALLTAIWDARTSWKTVPVGVGCSLVLMNIHSYDMLLVGLVGLGFLAVQVAQKAVSGVWLFRALIIALGAVPSALWFAYVLQNDAVFQARAATPTYAASPRQVIVGLLPLMIGAFASFLVPRSDAAATHRARIGALIAGVGLLAMFLVGDVGGNQFWLGIPVWALAFVLSVVASVLLATESQAINLMQTWALVGVVAIYFPALFQRKLAMGMALPWSVLAAWGIYQVLKPKEKQTRIAGGAVALFAMCFTSIFWIQREREYITSNVARTTFNAVVYPPEVRNIMNKLRSLPGRKVVLAMPGINEQHADESGRGIDAYNPPYVSDLNAMASGFGGAYSFAGHWSETPNYADRRNKASKFFLKSTPEAERQAILGESGARYLIAPVPEAFPDMLQRYGQEFEDFRSRGRVLEGGTQFVLIDLDEASAKPGD